MRTRDPDTKKQRLFEAALAEFATHGIAGARIDRIAKRAGVSAGLVYSFHDGKEGLFEAVHDAIVEQAVDGIPIDPDDLAGYAGRLYDATLEYPEVMRFMAWYALERGGSGSRPVVAEAMRAKAAAIADAQRRGVVDDRFAPTQLLALVIAIANMWQHGERDAGGLVPTEVKRATVVDAVCRLTAPAP